MSKFNFKVGDKVKPKVIWEEDRFFEMKFIDDKFVFGYDEDGDADFHSIDNINNNWLPHEEPKPELDWKAEAMIQALDISILHWHENVGKAIKNEPILLGSRYCALCNKYQKGKAGTMSTCDGCPVKQYTGEDLCAHTPYQEVATMAHSGMPSGSHTWEDLITVCWKQYEFLLKLKTETEKEAK